MIYYQILQAPNNIFSKMYIVGENTPIDLNDYCRVHKGIIDAKEITEDSKRSILHDLYVKYNIHNIEGYAGRSLSAGDIVMLDDKYILCASGGWIEL